MAAGLPWRKRFSVRKGRGNRRFVLDVGTIRWYGATQHGADGCSRRNMTFALCGSAGFVLAHGNRLETDGFMQIIVRDNNVDQALRALKKKLQREGVYREMKLRRHYEKPSEKRAREKAAAVRRARKLERKRLERDGVR